MLYFHITKLVILHYLGKRKTRKLRLYLNAVCCFANKHKKTRSNYHLSQPNHPSFAKQ